MVDALGYLKMKDKSDRMIMVGVEKETYGMIFSRTIQNGESRNSRVTVQQKRFAEIRARKIAMCEYLQI